MKPRLNAILNKTLSPSPSETGYNLRIEQYRGLCALMVFINHVAINLGAGSLSVLIFFCISGYVIGINHNTSKLDAWDYLKRRAVRLYPIYIVSIILCIYVSTKTSWYEIIGNMLFLQNSFPYIHITVPVFVNASSWSLNFEVLYYLLFIPLFYIRPKMWQILLCLLVPTLLFVHCPESMVFLMYYINGYYFWILGLILAWSTNQKDTIDNNHAIPLLSLMFLQMCLSNLGIGLVILNTLGIHSPVNVNWLFDLPFCLVVMCIITGNNNNTFYKTSKIFCYTFPVIVFTYLIAHHRLGELTRWQLCAGYWILSLAFYFETRVSGVLMNKLTGVGKMSYAIYLLHLPIGMLIHKTVFIQNRTTEILVKYILWFTVTFALSYLLERVMQPVIKRFFFPKPDVQASLSST